MMALICRDLRKSYGATEVLTGFSATFQAGRVSALVGSNGAGKTTLLRIVAGLQFADSGSVESHHALLYGGFDTMPLGGNVDGLRRALGLPPAAERGRAKLKRLSRGQLHSVGLEIALDLRPAVLLLDEPWTSLDPLARDRLSHRLRELAAANCVVVCSTHDLDEISRVADDVVFLRDGQATTVNTDQGPLDRDRLMSGYRGIHQ